MSMHARIIGLGQAAAGDDGDGLAVVEWLQAHGVPPDIEVLRAPEDSALVHLLETSVPVVLVDAVLQQPTGEVLELTPEELARRQLLPITTHGMGVGQAIELARLLAPDHVSPAIGIVAVSIARPRRYRQHLSARVAAAVPYAAERALKLAGA